MFNANPYQNGNIRRRIIEMAQEESSMMGGSTRAVITAFKDPTIQKFMAPLIHAAGTENAFEIFSEAFSNIIFESIQSGILLEESNFFDDTTTEKPKSKGSKRKGSLKRRKRRACSEDELSAPNSGMAG